jgi:renalase
MLSVHSAALLPPVAARLRMRRVSCVTAAAARDSGLIGGPSDVRDAPVLVSGGGMSGLAVATTLANAGVATLLVEQGRGVGGRVCTRHARGMPLSFDHGCQYFAPKGGEFAALLTQLESEGVVARWGAGGRLGEVACDTAGRIDWTTYAPQPAGKAAYVGVPSMSAVGRHLLAATAQRAGAATLTVAAGTRAAPGTLRRDGDAWLVDTHPKGDPAAVTTTRHRVVIAAGSASSTFNVISPAAPQLAAPAGAVRADACWGLLVAFEAPLLGAAGSVCDGALVSGSDTIAWAARDSSKPGRAAGAECWVVHAAPEWSNARRAAKPADAAAELLLAWAHACGLDTPPPTLYAEAFQWNAAFPLNPAAPPSGCFTDASLRLGLCGDWCVGPRAGDAWASGVAAANAVLRDML